MDLFREVRKDDMREREKDYHEKSEKPPFGKDHDTHEQGLSESRHRYEGRDRPEPRDHRYEDPRLDSRDDKRQDIGSISRHHEEQDRRRPDRDRDIRSRDSYDRPRYHDREPRSRRSSRYDEDTHNNYSRNGSRPRDHRPSYRDEEEDIGSVLSLDEWPRRLKNWDVPPIGFEGMSSEQVKATGLFIPASAQPKVTNLTPFAEAQPRLGFLSSSSASHPGASSGSTLAASSLNTRLIMSGHPAHWSEQEILQFLTDLFRSYGFISGSSSSTVKLFNKIHLIPEKDHALLDFVDPSLANQALLFDGYVWEGGRYILHVRKPKEASAVSATGAQMSTTTSNILPTADTVSHHVADTPAKIFIGCIPFALNEQDIMDILQTFGPLKSFHLVRDSQGHSKGYAFCDYLDPLVTDTACAGLNQFELLDKRLVVQRASHGKFGANPSATTHVSGSLGPMIVGSAGIQANVSTYATVASTLLPSLTKNMSNPLQPSPILQLLNVLDLNSPLLTQTEYQELLVDLVTECRKYGKILSAFLARPHLHEIPFADILPFSSIPIHDIFKSHQDTYVIPTHTWGKAFIQFETKAQAASAIDALAGRKFGDNILLSAYYSNDLYTNLEFN